MNMRDLILSKRLVGASDGSATVRNQHKVITENGVYKADSGYTGLGTVTVNVPEKVPALQEKTATENGVVVPDAGFDGLSRVTVNVATSGGSGGANKLAQLASETLTEITADDLRGVTSIRPQTFRELTSLLSVTINKELTTMKDYTFYSCTSLETLEFEENSQLTTMGARAFYNNTKMSHATIPEKVVSIGDWAFGCCFQLKTITVMPKTPPVIQSYTFSSTPLEVITVPLGCADAYKSATNWSKFADIIVEEASSGDTSGEDASGVLFSGETMTAGDYRTDLPVWDFEKYDAYATFVSAGYLREFKATPSSMYAGAYCFCSNPDREADTAIIVVFPHGMDGVCADPFWMAVDPIEELTVTLVKKTNG